jgi:glutamate racemase
MNSDQRPIGVFDSGIGGLSVLKHLVRMLPHERFVYLGDTARVPYGNKSAETIQLYARQCAAFLMQHEVKMIVVACNTASAIALEVLQETSPVPVVGVIEPAALEAVERSRSGIIGVIGTRVTVSTNAYAQAMHQAAGAHHIDVHSTACPLFVPLVEEGLLNHPATRLIASEYVAPLLANGIDTLVLGCTHYPLLTPLLQELLPSVDLVDCGECTARMARLILKQQGELSTVTDPRDTFFYITDHTPSFVGMAGRFLGTIVRDPVRVSIDHLVTTDS